MKQYGIFEGASSKKTGPLSAYVRYCVTAAVFLICLLGLSGCVKKYGRGDIRSYAAKRIGRDSLEVSDGYREVQEDEEGYLDHLWTVTDTESGLVFYVLDDYYWSMEKVQNKLTDDYDARAFLKLLEDGSLPASEILSLRQTEGTVFADVQITASFTNRAELQTCYTELCHLRESLEQAGYPGLQVPYTLQYRNPLTGKVDAPVDEGDTSGSIGDVDEEDLRIMQENYLTCALDYRFEDALREFTEEEINTIVHDPSSVRIYRKSDNEGSVPAENDYYEGVIGSAQYAGISFGTLYELLRIEGLKPQGNAWHYEVTAPDGGRLEFSYDFCDLSGFNDAGGKLQKGYYYILDGKKIRMKSYAANHFDASDINALTGLRVAEDRPYQNE